jgi:hypothetical protein
MGDNGLLLVSDISGYTGFLAESEKDHGDEVISGLLRALLAVHTPPLVVSKLEGDAILAYAEDVPDLVGQAVVDLADMLYVAFRSAQSVMQLQTTCTCRACERIPNLDLKVFAHRGAFSLQQIGAHQELSGVDVIAIHRLMKNTVREKTGIDAYGMITAAAAGPLQGDRFKSHREEYEHIGGVDCQVFDLGPSWQAHRDRPPERVSQQDADLVIDLDLPCDVPTAWQLVLRPETHKLLIGVTRVDQIDKSRASQIGSKLHCAHGPGVQDREIVDWRPFEFVTFADESRLFGFIRLRQQNTIEFHKNGEGTRLSLLLTRPDPVPGTPGFLVKLIWAMLKKVLPGDHQKGARALAAFIDKGGAVRLLPPAPEDGQTQATP